MLHQAHYQAAFQRSTLLFFHQQILPQLGPGPDKTRGSYMTDDGGPMELSCVTDGSGETIVRFSIEPLAAPDASRRFQSNRKEYVTQLLALPIISPGSDMEWFNIFSEALTLEDGKAPPLNPGATGTSEFFIGTQRRIFLCLLLAH
jgi:DMATS type aromatic prenyltransferase